MFFENARKGGNEFWMYLVGIILCFVGYFVGQIPLTIVLFKALADNPDLGMAELSDFQSNPDFSLFGIDSNLGLLILLLMFVGALVLLIVAVKYVHKRNFLSLINANNKIRWSRIFFGFGLWLFMTLVLEGVNYFINPDDYIFSVNWPSFLPLLLIALFILPLQTSFEELFFRGYLMPGMAIGLKNKWAPLLISSILFGLIHSMNPEVQEFGFFTMQFYYVSAGLLLGIITIMDDGLELALGVHWATNLYGAVFVGYKGAAIQTDSLMKTEDVNTTLMTAVFIVSAIIFVFICSKKYNWKPLSTIFEPIIEPKVEPLIDEAREHLL